MWISSTRPCDNADLLAGVLLQVGFELRRQDEWEQCRRFYRDHSAIPFPIALLWLQLRLADREFDFVKAVLLELRVNLQEECRMECSRPGNLSITGRSNYGEVMALLVTRVMIPRGENNEAIVMLSNDAILSKEEIDQLTALCYNHTMKGRHDGTSAVHGETDAHQLAHSNNVGSRKAKRTSRNEHPDSDFSHGTGVEEKGLFSSILDGNPQGNFGIAVGVGVAGLAVYTAYRQRRSLWCAVSSAVQTTRRATMNIATFIVGSS
ncbi:unnamed protein product [Choristocarpus tenellus]